MRRAVLFVLPLLAAFAAPGAQAQQARRGSSTCGWATGRRRSSGRPPFLTTVSRTATAFRRCPRSVRLTAPPRLARDPAHDTARSTRRRGENSTSASPPPIPKGRASSCGRRARDAARTYVLQLTVHRRRRSARLGVGSPGSPVHAPVVRVQGIEAASSSRATRRAEAALRSRPTQDLDLPVFGLRGGDSVVRDVRTNGQAMTAAARRLDGASRRTGAIRIVRPGDCKRLYFADHATDGRVGYAPFVSAAHTRPLPSRSCSRRRRAGLQLHRPERRRLGDSCT